MAKPKIRSRNPGNRSNGGRPSKDGDRYPSGKLRPPAPNAKVVAMREAMGLTKLGEKFTPIEVAHQRGWIDDETYWSAARYAALYHVALSGSGAPKHANQNLPEAGSSVDVRDLSFAALTHKEIVAIWDSAMGPAPRQDDPEERQQKAFRAWRDWNARMTPEQRQEIANTVIGGSWPQWIIQRAAGRFGTAWEGKRDALIAGLQGLKSTR